MKINYLLNKAIINFNEFVYEQAIKNPTSIKIAECAGLISGIGFLTSSPSLENGVFTFDVVRGVVGSGLILSAFTCSYFRDIFTPSHHPMEKHLYTEGEYSGGKLYYDKNIPILSLESINNPFDAGKAHGYLCGDVINKFMTRYMWVHHSWKKDPMARDISNFSEVKKEIPKEYLEELSGVVEGYKEWAEKNSHKLPKKFTLDDLLLFHLLPDPPLKAKGGVQISPFRTPVGCTSLIGKNEQGQIQLSRCLDWPSYGILGSSTLVIKRGVEISTLQVGFPGFVGTVTGMNENLCLSMNAQPGGLGREKGMPSVFMNRKVLEICKTVEEATRYLKESKLSPIGPYHLTLLDSDDRGASIHFLQSSIIGNRDFIRRFNGLQPLVVLNRWISETSCLYTTDPREMELDSFFHNNNRKITNALTLPHVNNRDTVQVVHMSPQNGVMEVAFDNSKAGNLDVSSLRFFSQKKIPRPLKPMGGGLPRCSSIIGGLNTLAKD